MKDKEITKAKKAVQTIAEKTNIPQDDIRVEMQAAIAEGMRNPDPAVKAMWKEVPCKGDVPEPEELIAWLAEQVRERYKVKSRSHI